ncbi:MAG: GGDEF domain-containing protein [Anaerolineales bacterium]|nr:GGDEF domain-containing protein [Anaerolineales bacterium]
MWVMFRDLFKTVFGDILTDLGNLEGDYRVAQLKSDITQSLLYMFIVSIGVLAMLEVDKKLFVAAPDVLIIVTTSRILFVLISIMLGVVLYRVDKVRVFDHLTFAWIALVVGLMLIFNFMTPADYLSTSFDIIVPFAIYILSPLPIKRTIGLAASFSIGTLGVYFFLKSGIDPVVLNVAISAQIIVHVLGVTSALQIHSYRRKSYQAFIDEKDAKEMVAYLANIDPLTKSLTRRQFTNIAESEFRRHIRYHRPLSILILDADRFKETNDTYGHHAGDLTLRSLSLVAMEQKRAQDTFGRLGGDEFGLLMPETTIDNALIVAERIRKTWEQSPVNLDGDLIHSTMSIGLAEAAPEDKSLEDILRRADRMLYKAKETGRNRVMS